MSSNGNRRRRERPLISAVMIARDEQENVERCFSSLWDACCEVVLVDTGSRDGTIATARKFAEDRGEPEKLIVGHFTWREDYAAARNHADSLATGDWLLSIDLDETIRGADVLPELAANAAADTVGFSFRHVIDEMSSGECIACGVNVVRLVRAGVAPWERFIDERRAFPDGITILRVPPSVCEWVHLTRLPHAHFELRERLLESFDDEDAYPAVLMPIELALQRGEHRRAIDLYRNVLSTHEATLPKRIAVVGPRQLVRLLLEEGEVDEAREIALGLLDSQPGSAHAALAEIALMECEYEVAVDRAQKALQCPEKIDDAPLHHSLPPRYVLVWALVELYRDEEALAVAREVLAIDPDDESMAPFLRELMRRDPLGTMALGAGALDRAGIGAVAQRASCRQARLNVAIPANPSLLDVAYTGVLSRVKSKRAQT